MKAKSILAVFLILALLLSACAASPTVTSSPTASGSSASPTLSTSSPASPTTNPSSSASPGPYIGLASGIVDGIYATMKAKLGLDVTIAQEPFLDAISNLGGWCQALIAKGTGNDFASPAITAQILASILEKEGWKEDLKLAADGPTGTARGYRQDKALALIEVTWQPDSSVTIDPNKPIESQEIPLGQAALQREAETGHDALTRLLFRCGTS